MQNFDIGSLDKWIFLKILGENVTSLMWDICSIDSGWTVFALIYPSIEILLNRPAPTALYKDVIIEHYCKSQL